MNEVNDIDSLYGIFQHYTDGKPLTDKDIEDAIGEAMFERNFKCCPTYENMTYEEFNKIEWNAEVDEETGKISITKK